MLYRHQNHLEDCQDRELGPSPTVLDSVDLGKGVQEFASDKFPLILMEPVFGGLEKQM